MKKVLKTLAEVTDYAVQIGPAARFIAETPEDQRPAQREALSKAFEPYVSERGVWMTGACWIVTAANP